MKIKIIFLISAVFFSSFYAFAQVSAKSLSISGIKQPVTVRRDSRSIPYIDAKNEADLYFVQGYETAKDRLWQMELLKRLSRGQLAEILGKPVLEQDKQWRRYGFASIAEESLKIMNPKLKLALENYARGVNARIAELNDESLPIEFKLLSIKPSEWKPGDTVCVGKILAEGLSSSWRGDLIRASLQKLPKEKYDFLTNPVTANDVVLFGKDIPQPKKETPKVAALDKIDLKFANDFERIREESLSMAGFFAEDLAASNNWVISGKRTKDGKAILANDPHLAPTAPGIWYLTHLSTPTMRVSGVTFPGVPGVVLGHNESIAWGATNIGPDVQDLYTEEFNEKGEYKTEKGWMAPKKRSEAIKVRRGLTKETETETIEVIETRNGILIQDEVGQKFALKWTARDPKNQEFEAFFLLNRAKNWADFQNSLKTYGGASQNFIYADTKGNIGWIAAGRIPLRRKGDGSLPYIGASGDGDWIGYIPFAELPTLYNPPGGYIATANQRIVGTGYKYQQLTRDFAAPWRAKRINDILKGNTKVTMDDVSDIQNDIMSIPHSKLAWELLKRGAASPETLADLQAWDGRMLADAKAPLLINEIRNCLSTKIAEENPPVPFFVVRERVLWQILDAKPAEWLPKAYPDYIDFYKACDAESKANLRKRFGEDESKWRWGNAFTATYLHPLSLAPLIGKKFEMKFTDLNGSGVTPNVGASVSMRLVTSPQDWDSTRHAIPLGESGDPESPHWKDQLADWKEGKTANFPFSPKAVEQAAVETIMMSPK